MRQKQSKNLTKIIKGLVIAGFATTTIGAVVNLKPLFFTGILGTTLTAAYGNMVYKKLERELDEVERRFYSNN